MKTEYIYEENFEIDGMKFKIVYEGHPLFGTFNLYDEKGNVVGCRRVRVESELDPETWQHEVAEPSARGLKAYVAKNYLITETMGLNAADLHKTADSAAELKDATFRKDWFRYLTNKIKDAAEHGLYEIILATGVDKDMPEGYNETVMKDETVKVLTAKGFTVKLANLKNAFAIIIRW